MNRALAAVFGAVLAFAVLKSLADLGRGGHVALAIVVGICLVTIGAFLRRRREPRQVTVLSSPTSERSVRIFRQIPVADKVHISSLAASGNAIGAISALRKAVKIDLRSAKELVDEITPTKEH